MKEGTSVAATPSTRTTMPVIPPWGTEDSHERVETEPVATFQISRNAYSTEIVFDPPMYLPSQLLHILTLRTGRFVLMKLFNDIYGEQSENNFSARPIPLERRDPPSRAVILGNLLRGDDIPAAIGDPLRFDMMDDELEDADSSFGDLQEGDADFENVDVQAILFYGYTGRRRFPSIKAL
jgi:hypothetical protein